MTTKKVVADGKSEAEIRGLVQIKTNELVRRILEKTLKLEWVLDRMQTGIIEGPSGWEEMIPIPLDWSTDFGEIPPSDLRNRVLVFNSERKDVQSEKEWRLPTEKELDRVLKDKKVPAWTYYWSSTPHFDGRGLTVVYKHAEEGLGSRSHLDLPLGKQRYPHLFLCREKKLD